MPYSEVANSIASTLDSMHVLFWLLWFPLQFGWLEFCPVLASNSTTGQTWFPVPCLVRRVSLFALWTDNGGGSHFCREDPQTASFELPWSTKLFSLQIFDAQGVKGE
ncbi:uncharacterized protein LOC111318390 isoform X3 [Durio zibethinus]|uniref:Uncharacterized protein LOC111318390 isoform X3 n=1 Tax=Durio zibethinus TaxID=66656 RepID=A0A6P6BIM9_DURZI|nr:uncharacterized protein LOC111318390 isoform X3 [Durio zibethinus]